MDIDSCRSLFDLVPVALWHKMMSLKAAPLAADADGPDASPEAGGNSTIWSDIRALNSTRLRDG